MSPTAIIACRSFHVNERFWGDHLYVSVGHRRNQFEEDFLKSVANTLACLVEIRNQSAIKGKSGRT
jgi:hypothetical protein